MKLRSGLTYSSLHTEIEINSLADKGKLINYAILEHIENAGVHFADATLILPARKLYLETIKSLNILEILPK